MTNSINEMQANSNDRIVRGTAADGMIRALAITAPQTVCTAQAGHNLSPVATAALGRLLLASQIIGSLLKNDGEIISLMVEGEGPLQRLTAVSDTQGNAKGYVADPNAQAAFYAEGQPDVPSGIGDGALTVVRNSPHMEPYVSQIALVNGTICDDLTAYYIVSEQIPTIIALDVILSPDGTVTNAGGFLVQLMPGYDDALLEQLQAALYSARPLRAMLQEGLPAEDILESVLPGLGFRAYESIPAAFRCDCDRERSERTLLSLGKSELQEIIDDNEPIEIKCDFCGKGYSFSIDELKELASQVH